MRSALYRWVVTLACALVTGPALADPSFHPSFGAFGFPGATSYECVDCHVHPSGVGSCNASPSLEHPRSPCLNAFGRAYRQASAYSAIVDADADGDTFANGTELNRVGSAGFPEGAERVGCSMLGAATFAGTWRACGSTNIEVRATFISSPNSYSFQFQCALGASPAPLASTTDWGSSCLDQDECASAPCGPGMTCEQLPLGPSWRAPGYRCLITCGNGALDPGEQCDLGISNDSPSSCCSATCNFRAAGQTCRHQAAGGSCDVAETCSGISGLCPPDGFRAASTLCRASRDDCDAPEYCTGASAFCPHDAPRSDGTSCSDGLVCNGDETCMSGVCTPGTSLACDDSNPCTIERCVEPAGCEFTPVYGCCNDDRDCDDGNECTVDSCTSATAECRHEPIEHCAPWDELDAGVEPDAGVTVLDAGGAEPDAGMTVLDAGGVEPDAGMTVLDAGGVEPDAGMEAGVMPDGGKPPASKPEDTKPRGGCGCSAPGHRTLAWADGLMLALFTMLLLRKRARVASG